MANTPALPESPKHHTPLTSAEEVAESAIHRAEDENREFYEASVNLPPGNEVTLLQTGISERCARALVRGQPQLNALPPGEAYARRSLEEKMSTELYRAVAGNEIYDTEHGEDSLHYRRSVNREHLDAGLARRAGRKFNKVYRGAISMVGANNYIEAQVEERFGANRDPDARRQFVADRLLNPLTALQGALPLALFNNVCAELGLPPGSPVPQVQLAIEQATLTDLRRVRDVLAADPAGLAFNGLPEFNDMMLLVNIEQKIGADFRVDNIYNREPLRQFWGDLPQALRNQVTDTLAENELFPLDSNPDSTALMAELRGRYYANVSTGAVPNPAASLAAMIAEIRDIRNNESPRGEQTEEQRNLTNTINEQITEMRNRQGSLQASFATLRQIPADIAVINARIAAGGMTPQQVTDANGRIATLQTQQNQAVAAHKPLEQEYSNFARILVNNLNTINGRPGIPPLLTTAAGLPPSPDAMLNSPPAVPPGPANPFEVHIVNNGNAVRNDLDQTIPNTFLNLLRGRTRMTSFTLLQRLMRRDYMNRQNQPLNPRLYNEEANHYANLKAALRVEDVKSADRKRTANQQAAEILNRGILGRGWDKLKYAVAKGQNFVGLEPINFSEITADKMLEQIINSEDEFTVFRGIDKFTTLRDLRNVINKTGRTVPRETLERFSLVLEEAISRFKSVRPSLEKGLDPDDWDLENLITVFKKMKAEMWSRQFLDQVEATGEPGEREHTLVRMLAGSRQNERNIEESVSDDVKDPDAMWRVYLAKDDLKRVLNEKHLDAANKIRGQKIADKQAKIADLQRRLAATPEVHRNRTRLEAEIASLQNSIEVAEDQTRMAQTLHDKVQRAREYIKENKLSRKQRKEYLDSMGLTQVFDKMSTNFRLQNTWKFTKKAAGKMWSGTKHGWAWNRKKWLNKEGARKAYEVGKYAAFLGPRLIGKSLEYGTLIPRHILGTMSKSVKKGLYERKLAIILKKAHRLKAKQRRLEEKTERAKYSFTKDSLNKKVNRLERKIHKLRLKMGVIEKKASERSIQLGEIKFYSEAANDNGSIETYRPAA